MEKKQSTFTLSFCTFVCQNREKDQYNNVEIQINFVLFLTRQKKQQIKLYRRRYRSKQGEQEKLSGSTGYICGLETVIQRVIMKLKGN